jgi:DNA-binding CsgD family transcriptional regulator
MTSPPPRLRLVLRWLTGMVAGAVLVPAVAGPVSAHEGNVGFSEIVVAGSEVEYTLWLDVKHLAAEVPLADAGDVPVVNDPGAPELSERELEILRLLALGHSNPEIAERLELSVRTVESHRARLQRRLGIAKRSELVRYALEHGLLREALDSFTASSEA